MNRWIAAVGLVLICSTDAKASTSLTLDPTPKAPATCQPIRFTYEVHPDKVVFWQVKSNQYTLKLQDGVGEAQVNTRGGFGGNGFFTIKYNNGDVNVQHSAGCVWAGKISR